MALPLAVSALKVDYLLGVEVAFSDLSVDGGLSINSDDLCAGAREKHAVNFVAIGTIHRKVHTFERMVQNFLCLVKPTENQVTFAATATNAAAAGRRAGRYGIGKLSSEL